MIFRNPKNAAKTERENEQETVGTTILHFKLE
jgi:hypothetical protein